MKKKKNKKKKLIEIICDMLISGNLLLDALGCGPCVATSRSVPVLVVVECQGGSGGVGGGKGPRGRENMASYPTFMNQFLRISKVSLSPNAPFASKKPATPSAAFKCESICKIQ